MTLGETWEWKISMALMALRFLFILKFLTDLLLLSKHSFLIVTLFWTDFVHIITWALYLFFFSFNLVIFICLFFLFRLPRSDTPICWLAHLCISFFAVHQMLLDFSIIWAQRGFAVIALNGRSLTFIEKMVADIWFHHYFFAPLALITSVITIFVKLFVNKLIVSHFCGTPIEFTAKLQFTVVQVNKSYISVIINQIVKLSKFMGLFHFVLAI